MMEYMHLHILKLLVDIRKVTDRKIYRIRNWTSIRALVNGFMLSFYVCGFLVSKASEFLDIFIQSASKMHLEQWEYTTAPGQKKTATI